jgi:N-acetylneuraminic acid mutarotase
VFSDSLDIYDPVTNTCSKGSPAPMPVSIWAKNACVYAGEMYIFGGRGSNGAPPETFVWSYNPSQDSWSAKTPMTASRDQFACVEVGGEIYLLGGRGADNRATDVVERFNPLRQTWSTPTRLPSSRVGLSAVAIGHRIFVVGGGRTVQTGSDFVEILDTDVL